MLQKIVSRIWIIVGTVVAITIAMVSIGCNDTQAAATTPTSPVSLTSVATEISEGVWDDGQGLIVIMRDPQQPFLISVQRSNDYQDYAMTVEQSVARLMLGKEQWQSEYPDKHIVSIQPLAGGYANPMPTTWGWLLQYE